MGTGKAPPLRIVTTPALLSSLCARSPEHQPARAIRNRLLDNVRVRLSLSTLPWGSDTPAADSAALPQLGVFLSASAAAHSQLPDPPGVLRGRRRGSRVLQLGPSLPL